MCAKKIFPVNSEAVLTSFIGVFYTGRPQPGWGKEACRPVWWPAGMEFSDVNNAKSRPRLDKLVLIMTSYRDWTLEEQSDCEMITVDDLAHSPQIPIPVASTPATASSSNPPPEAPGSPIVPPSPVHLSTPVVASCSNSPPPPPSPPEVPGSPLNESSSTPATSSTLPPLTFGELVRRKFGSDSAYLDNSWKPVLQASGVLNHTQRAKMLSILSTLNEDVSN